MTIASEVAEGLAPTAADAGRYAAFLSYAREDNKLPTAFAIDRLRTALEERGQQVWIDVDDVPVGAQWRARVKRGIEACKAFIFVVSPASVGSEPCRQELEEALALQKLIIPVIYRDVDDGVIPPAVAEAEWVFLRDEDDQPAGIAKLVDALETDLEWRDQHTRLAGRAREWLDAGRDSSYLLRGSDLREAEDWLGQQEGHRAAPTREQAEYIARSRQSAARRQRTIISSLAAGLLVAIGLAVFALIQRYLRRAFRTVTAAALLRSSAQPAVSRPRSTHQADLGGTRRATPRTAGEPSHQDVRG
jgi:TIR domain